MGVQNIKGTGLDFVYRWLAWQNCSDYCDMVESGNSADFQQGLRMLSEFHEYGVLCDERVQKILEVARNSPFAQREQIQIQINLIEAHYRDAVAAKSSPSKAPEESVDHFEWFRQCYHEIRDVAAAVGRRKRADRIYKDLVSEQISFERAVIELRNITRPPASS